MIARMWHGVTLAAQAEAYMDYLTKTGIADYRATEGNRGVYVLRRVEGDQAHFLLLTFWESWSAIEQFTGQDINMARYYPEDEAYLLTLEPLVSHYEVMVASD